jgi:hypothetical protein
VTVVPLCPTSRENLLQRHPGIESTEPNDCR